jgi:heat shock protein HslJ
MPAKRPATLLCLLACMPVACDDDDFDASGATGVEWRLQSLQRADGAVLQAAPRRYTLRLDADGTAHVRSDCNSCVGGYTLSGSSLGLTALACTRAFCGEASLDQPYVRALQSARTVDGSPERLVVRGAEGTLRFSR